ncbi:glycosyltransferase family 2 protein [Cupriavidus campinensis]|uniref:glycosyltransferase family 2 protein n=1 Tax=Cupriavidus campinensis TaxID=151783 RepID=UPI0011EEBBD2|nr:glycosyltransferase family 2 protein [Cupriavidus campinensis]
MPKVSICIPAYRQVAFLRRTLQSVIDQHFTNYELIVTDDSPDDSVETLLTEFDFGGRLRYVRNATQLGSPENWNAALRQASGEYLKILHHDDNFTDAEALGDFVRLLDDNPQAGFGFCATLIVDVATGHQRIHRASESQMQALRAMPEVLFAGNFVGAPSTTIYRREFALDYDTRMKWLVDLDFYIRILQEGADFAFSPRPLICTPTNAAHQVTEECRDSGRIELYEYSLLFGKVAGKVAERVEIKGQWDRLFEKYRIRSRRTFLKYDVAQPEPAEYFDKLIASYRRRRFLTLHGLARVFYAIYPKVPAPIRAPIRWTKNGLMFVLGRQRKVPSAAEFDSEK